MKILIIRTFPGYMNVKNNTYNIQEIGLAKALIRKGHICDIVFWTDNAPETITYKFDGDKELKIFYLNGKNILNNAIYKNIDGGFSCSGIVWYYQLCILQVQSLRLRKSNVQCIYNRSRLWKRIKWNMNMKP